MINYLLQMRNYFGESSNHNVVSVKEQDSITDETNPASSENFKSSAPLLPSTGPEIFAIIAIVGIFMMIFGTRRKQ